MHRIAEAADNAIKIARSFTGKQNIIAFDVSAAGVMSACLSACPAAAAADAAADAAAADAACCCCCCCCRAIADLALLLASCPAAVPCHPGCAGRVPQAHLWRCVAPKLSSSFNFAALTGHRAMCRAHSMGARMAPCHSPLARRFTARPSGRCPAVSLQAAAGYPAAAQRGAWSWPLCRLPR